MFFVTIVSKASPIVGFVANETVIRFFHLSVSSAGGSMDAVAREAVGVGLLSEDLANILQYVPLQGRSLLERWA